MHAPLMILPSNHNLNSPRTINPNVRIIHEDPRSPDPDLIQEKKVVGLKRDVGVQSAPENVRAVKTPPIMEISTNVDYAPNLEAQQEDVEFEEKEQNNTKKENEEEDKENEKKKKKRGSGCFSWIKKMQRQSRKSKCMSFICLPSLTKAC